MFKHILLALIAISAIGSVAQAQLNPGLDAQGHVNIQVRDQDGTRRTIKAPIKILRPEANATATAETRQRPAVSTRAAISASSSVATRLTAHARARITAHIDQLISRLSSAVSRSENLLARLKSRIDKFESQGKDMSIAKQKVASTETKIKAAVDAVTALDTSLNLSIGSSSPRQAFGQSKDLIQETIESIKTAHASVVELIQAVRVASDAAVN